MKWLNIFLIIILKTLVNQIFKNKILGLNQALDPQQSWHMSNFNHISTSQQIYWIPKINALLEANAIQGTWSPHKEFFLLFSRDPHMEFIKRNNTHIIAERDSRVFYSIMVHSLSAWIYLILISYFRVYLRNDKANKAIIEKELKKI